MPVCLPAVVLMNMHYQIPERGVDVVRISHHHYHHHHHLLHHDHHHQQQQQQQQQQRLRRRHRHHHLTNKKYLYVFVKMTYLFSP